MLRKVVGAVAILAITLGVAMAEDIKGKIVKISDTKVSVVAAKQKEAKEYDIAKDCKVCKLDKKNKVEVAGGLKAEQLQNIDPVKGIQATVVVTDGKVTEIILAGKKKAK
jgi:hypothetical protein